MGRGEDEDEMSYGTASTVRKQDGDIHPRQLSGDENQESSILASYANNTKANFFLTTTIIVKSTIGAGIIALPFTFSKLGYVLGPIAFLAFLAMNQFCTILLLKSKNLSRHSNFSTILYYIWHSDASRIFGSALIFVDNLGTCILEFILIKTSIQSLAKELADDPNILDSFWLSDFFIVVVAGIIEFPMTLIKKIEKLRVFSFLGVAGVIVFIVGIIVLYILRVVDGYELATMSAFPEDWFAAASAMVNLCFAFNFQMNFFPIFKGLRDPSDSKMAKACFVGLIECAIPYLTVAFLGYSLAGRDSKANFLESLDYQTTNNFLYLTINFCYIFSILFAIVLMFFGCRNNLISIVNIVRKRRNKHKKQKLKLDEGEGDGDGDYEQEDDPLTNRANRMKRANKEYYIITVILNIVMIAASIVLQNIELVFNFLGAVCQSLVSVILPCLFYVMLVRMEEQRKRFIYYLSIVVMVLIIPYSIFSVIVSYLPSDQVE